MKPKVDPEHVAEVRDRELENALQQKQFYEEEIVRLEHKINELSGVTKLLHNEDQLKDTKEQIN